MFADYALYLNGELDRILAGYSEEDAYDVAARVAKRERGTVELYVYDDDGELDHISTFATIRAQGGVA